MSGLPSDHHLRGVETVFDGSAPGKRQLPLSPRPLAGVSDLLLDAVLPLRMDEALYAASAHLFPNASGDEPSKEICEGCVEGHCSTQLAYNIVSSPVI